MLTITQDLSNSGWTFAFLTETYTNSQTESVQSRNKAYTYLYI